MAAEGDARCGAKGPGGARVPPVAGSVAPKLTGGGWRRVAYAQGDVEPMAAEGTARYSVEGWAAPCSHWSYAAVALTLAGGSSDGDARGRWQGTLMAERRDDATAQAAKAAP